MQKDLLSIVTPCFNSGAFIHRLLDSILSQTYPSVEMYLIDDGSTDNTKGVIDSYFEKFKAKGYELYYIYQANSGQSEAINNGLRYIKGEFFVWPDSDDYYRYPDSLEKLVAALKSLPEEVAMVRCRNICVDEHTGETTRVNPNGESYSSLFEDCLYVKNNFWFLSGGYVVRTQALFNVLKNKSIFSSKNAGQNWQLLLPMLYNYECHTIEEYLYVVVERQASHSRGQYSTFEKLLEKFDAYEATIVNTINIIDMPEGHRNQILENISNKYLLERLKTSYKFKNSKKFREFLCKVEKSRDVVFYLRLYSTYLPFGLKIQKIFKRRN